MDLLITHTDLDGISPVILMNLTGRKFDYKNVEICEIDTVFDELNEIGFDMYENIYVTDLTLTEHAYSILDKLNNVLVFDHHETHLWANEKKYVNVSVNLNSRQTCGTELFYEYLKTIYPTLNTNIVSEYVQLVRELDTYNFTSEIPLQLEQLRKMYGKIDFIKLISRRLKKDKEHFSFSAFENRMIKLKDAEKERYIFQKDLKLRTFEIDNLKCGVVFAETYKSELGNKLHALHPELDLIIIFDSSSSVSYRTIKDDVRVNDFASIYGGGGHVKASGSNISDEIREQILKLYFEKDNIKIKKLTNND